MKAIFVVRKLKAVNHNKGTQQQIRMASKDTSKMTKQTLRLGVEILEEQLRQAGEKIAELKRRLKIAESLACDHQNLKLQTNEQCDVITSQMAEIAELKRRLKIAESLACECCGEIENEEGEFRKNGGRFVGEWQCFACPKCIPPSFDIEAADELIEKLQKMKQEAMETERDGLKFIGIIGI